jgi:hypothetical protein
VYACPSDTGARSLGETDYFVVVGPGTAFPGSGAVSLNDITRPLSETILVVEAIDQHVCWMEPTDLEFTTIRLRSQHSRDGAVSSLHSRGPNVCMGDVTKRTLRESDQTGIKEMLLIK